ncbi:MAG: radical SAM protein [Polyangiaceae bacterium]|nr:radical SAM protein [Polyangiaceae bacterium]
MLVRRGPNGELRYLRAQDPAHQEYSYRNPFILELEVTRRCNLHCVHCYAEAENRAYDDELSLPELLTVLDDARALGMRELSLTGGEVFMRPDFLHVVDAGLERDFAVRFVTNGTLLDDQLLLELCARPIKLITVSLDAVSPGPHERIRGPGSHAPAVAAIDRLLTAGFRLSIITAFSALNLDDFDPLLDFCLKRRIDWQVQMTSAKGRCRKGLTLTPDQYYELGRRVANALAARLPIHLIPMDDLATFSYTRPLAQLSQTWQGQCTGGLLNLFVRANGDVTPCSALAFPECVVGNVRRESLRRVCEEERCKHNLAWLRPDTLTGACARCPFRAECRGGCPEILMCMCTSRTENEYCYRRIEEQRILSEALQNG